MTNKELAGIVCCCRKMPTKKQKSKFSIIDVISVIVGLAFLVLYIRPDIVEYIK